MKVYDYHEGNRELQDKFGTRKLADRMVGRVTEVLGEGERAFIESVNMFFLATSDKRGLPTCSYKGGHVGFVRVLDEHTIAFPNYDGNGIYQSMGNLLENPNAGILFIDFDGQRRLRIQGVATMDENDPLMAEYHEAQFIVRVRITESYTNCPRYIPKQTLVEESKYLPEIGRETPQPDWKSRPEYQV